MLSVPQLTPACTPDSTSPCCACCRAASTSHTKDGRHGLFGTLQGTEAGPPSVDCWMGHPLVNPTKGKLGLAAPTDLKGESPFHPFPLHPGCTNTSSQQACFHRAKPLMQHAPSRCMQKHIHRHASSPGPYAADRAACSLVLCGS